MVIKSVLIPGFFVQRQDCQILQYGVVLLFKKGSAMFITKTSQCNQCKTLEKCCFHLISPKRLNEIALKKRNLTFARGETIFHIGDDAGFFYCILSGKIQLYRSNPYREQTFSILGKNEWVGHRDVIAGGEYKHNARCLAETTVCKIPADILFETMKAEPQFGLQVASNLANSWIGSEHQSYNLGARKVMERLADFLLQYPGEGEVPDAANREIDLSMTREMLATLMGTTTESVIRTLSQFKSRGWIRMSKGKVRYINPQALANLVEEA